MTELGQSKTTIKKSLILVGLVIVLTSVLAVQALQRINAQLIEDNHQALETVLNATNETLNLWADNSFEDLTNMAQRPELVALVETLLDVERNQIALSGSEAQLRLRTYVKQNDQNLALGYFVIAPDYTSLASMRDHNIGSENIIAKQKRSILDKVFAGENSFVPPIRSAISSIETGSNKRLMGEATAFFLAPIKNANGDVIAALSMRVDPLRTFSKITRSGRIGDSGETYAFDDEATLVSESRFKDDLEQLGLLQKGDFSILNIQIKQDQHTASPQLTLMASEALQKKRGFNMSGYLDYRNVPVVGAWLWNERLNIGLTTEMDHSEAFASQRYVQQIIFIMVIAIVALFVLGTVISLVFFIRTQKSLNAANAQLEHQVQQRTKALSASQERVNKLLESTPEPILVVNAEGKIEQTNDATVRMFGYEFDEILGQPIDILIPQRYHQHHFSLFSSFMQNPKRIRMTERGDIEAVTKSGEHLIVEINLNPIKLEGDIFVIAGIRDITQQKKAEQQLVQAIRIADDANQAKSDFLANMSHEIRTPMNAIIGMSHLALQTGLDKKAKNYVEKVHRSAESLLGIINDILDFSKIEAGKLDIEQIEFYLDDVMHNFANLVGLRAEEKGLELHFDIANDVPSNLIGDPLRLGQVLTNLGNNAVKFTETGGQVVVQITVEKRHEHDVRLHFCVKDTGIGMRPDQLSKLFQSFSQADSSTTRKYGGTGLGLAISKRLSELMGGEIWAESEENNGSEFHFTSQFQVSEVQKPRQQVATSSLGELKALVVDDNATAREILKQMLESFKFEVETAQNGFEALEKLHENDDKSPFELVFMDWKMPTMDGIETTRGFQQKQVLKNQPTVIMVTAYGREDAVSASGLIDFGGFLTKPVTPSGLLDAILLAMGKEIVEGRRNDFGQANANDAIAQLQGADILLVEDNEMNQELAIELLQSNGLRVTLAENGQEALDKLATHSFDGVLMDCQMPVMDGYTAAKTIRRDEKFEGLPIIAMTANAMAGDKEKVLACGMDDHIAKPIIIGDMFNTMAKWITPKNPLSAKAQRSLPKDVVLPELTSLDMKKGLSTTQNNNALYLKLLKRFHSGNQHFTEQFEQALATSQEDATRLAHTLKGTAGSIGATEIQSTAADLESACKLQNQDLEPLVLAVTNALTPVLAELDQLSQMKTESAESVEVDSTVVRAKLEELKSLIEDYDTDAADLLEELEPMLNESVQKSALQQLSQAIENYDFETALEHLEQLENNSAA